MRGVVKKIIEGQDCGFIRGEDQVEYFFHKTSLKSDTSFDKLSAGDGVTFKPGGGLTGPRAVSVKHAEVLSRKASGR